MALDKLTIINNGGLSTTSDYRVGVLTATKFVGPIEGGSASFTGNVSIGGTLSYEDVTNIDSVGIITARNGINVTGGKVGIGTDNPSYTLDIRADAFTKAVIQGTGSNSNNVPFYIMGGNSATQIGNHPSAHEETIVFNSAGNYLAFETVDTERLRITSNGNIGINTHSPRISDSFDIFDKHFTLTQGYPVTWLDGNSSTKRGRFLCDSGGNFIWQFGSSTEEKVRFKSDGKVGIGTAIPENLPLTVAASTAAIALVDTDRTNSNYYSAVWGDQVGNLHLVADYEGAAGSQFISARIGGTALSNEKLRITTDGEVGINTTVVPYGNFAVDHGQYGLTRISNHSHLLLQNKNAGNTTFWSLIPRDNARFGIGRGTPDANGTVSDEKFTISSSGRIGINTISPQTILHIKQIADGKTDGIRISRPNGNATYSQFIDSSSRFNIGYSNPNTADPDPQITLRQSGQVGIGTNNPTELIDVLKTSNDAQIKVRTSAAGAYFIADSASGGYYGIKLNNNGTEKWFLGSYGSNDLQIKDGGATANDVFTIKDNTGYVGIGTDNPQAKLDVYVDNTDLSGIIQVTQDGTGDAAIDFQLKGTREYSLGIDNSDSDKFKLSGSAGLQNNTLLTVTNDGKVGINETSPAAQLHVENNNAHSSTYHTNNDAAILVQNKNSNSSAKTVLKLEEPAGGGDCALVYGASSTNMIFADRQHERLRIDSNGRMGLGTNNPTSLFHMSGSAPRITLTDTAGTDDIAKIFSTGGALYFQQRDGSSHGNIIFRTENDSGAEERLRIQADGDVSFGDVTTGRAQIKHVSGNQGDVNGGGFPQYAFVGNEGTGMRRASSNVLAFDTNGAQRIRITSDGDIVTQGLTDHSYNNDGNNTKILEVTNNGTVGKYGVINISGNQNSQSVVGAIKFINRENTNSSSAANAQSKALATIDVFAVTSDSNADDDCGGMLRIITKADGGGNAERIRFNADGTIRAGGGTFTESAIRLVLNNPDSNNCQMQFQSNNTGNNATDGLRIGYNGLGGQMWNFEDSYLRFATKNIERLNITSEGEVKIPISGKLTVGHTNPSARFTVGPANGSTNIEIEEYGVIRGYNRNSSAWSKIEFEGSHYVFDTDGTEKMRLISGGDLLIGTQTTAGKLTVDSGTSNTCATFQSSDAGAGINLVDNSARSSLEQNGASFKISSDTGAQQASSDIRLQLDGGTKVYIENTGLRMEANDNVFIEIPSDERCIVFDEGQKMITSNDGQGNFNIFGGKNHDAQHVSSSSGNSGIAQIEINTDGSHGNINFGVGPTRSAGSTANFEKGFRFVYYSNTSSERLNGLRYTTGNTTSPGGLGTEYPVIHRGNAADGSWANNSGDGFKVLGDGGSIAITTNDGHGNCNVCWNHKDGIPDTAGSSWRIRADIDNTNSHWLVQNSKSVSSGNAVSLTTRFEIDENGAGYINGQSFTSDQRLKKNIKNITGATDKIKSLTGRTFEWKEELEYGEGTKYGFVAQELETVLPELVSKALVHFDKDGNIIQDNYSNKDEIVDTAKTVNTIGVIPVLVEALKEALSEIDSLKARVSTLEGS